MRIRILISAVMMAFLLTACAKQVTAGTDSDQPGEAADVKLLEKAAPQSSALKICRFDGTNTIRRIVFDEAWKDKVINAVNSLNLKLADENALSGWKEPCYGISMGDTDGMEIWLTYSNGLWIEKGGALYRGELDLAAYFDEAASLDRTLEYTSGSGISMPNAAVLAKRSIKYCQKASGEEVKEKDGVSLNFVSIDGSKVTVEYKNNTDREYLYGDYYYLQKSIDGAWYQIPVALSNYGFNDIGHILKPGGSVQFTCDLTMYGELEAGHYRIVKENLYAEFDIGSDFVGITEQGIEENTSDEKFTMLDPKAQPDIEIFGLSPSDNRVSVFLDKIGEIPYMYDNDTCYNIIPAEISEKYGIDVFKFDQSCMSYIMYDGAIYNVGAYFGGFGITDFALADINGDGQKELYFTSSWGSGMHRSQVGFFDPATREVTFFEYSNYNHDMAFHADGNMLTICNASVNFTSFVDITVTASNSVGMIVVEDNEIKLNITDRTVIDDLFETIMSSPAASSNPSDYMNAHEDAVTRLVDAKDASLKYIFEEFMKGNQTGLKGHIMKLVLDRIAPEDVLDLSADTGQQYFDEWEKAAVKLLETHDYDWLKENHPAMFLLVEMVQEGQ